MMDSKYGVCRLTALNEKFPEQIEAAERIMCEDQDVLHEPAKR